MKWVIEILNDRLRQMNDAYDKFVVNGNADANGDNAKSNRDKVEQLTNAIKILSTNIDTSERQLTIPAVVGRSEQLVCGGCGRKYDEMDYKVGLCYECGLII